MAKPINAETGFNIRTNLYIMRCIFNHVKKPPVKKEIFYDKIGIDRGMFQVICGGGNYYLKQEQREGIAACFNIEEKYFAEGGEMFIVHGLDEQKWKCFFNRHYSIGGYDMAIPDQKQEVYKEEVEKKLEECRNYEYIEKSYATDSPIFRVAYYFTNDIAFQEELPIQRFVRELENLQVTDWDSFKHDRKKLEACRERLEENIQYIQALLTILKYKA